MATELSAYGGVFSLRGDIEDDVEIKSEKVLIALSDGTMLIFHEMKRGYSVEVLQRGKKMPLILPAGSLTTVYLRWRHKGTLILAPYEQSWILTPKNISV